MIALRFLYSHDSSMRNRHRTAAPSLRGWLIERLCQLCLWISIFVIVVEVASLPRMRSSEQISALRRQINLYNQNGMRWIDRSDIDSYDGQGFSLQTFHTKLSKSVDRNFWQFAKSGQKIARWEDEKKLCNCTTVTERDRSLCLRWNRVVSLFFALFCVKATSLISPCSA